MLRGGRPVEHAPDLGVESGAILNVHRDVLQEHDVERAVGEAQIERIADLEGGHGVHAAASAQILRRVDKGSAEIDAGHVAAVGSSEVPGRAADPTTQIQHPGLGRDRRHRRQVFGGEHPAGVELVHRGEVGDGKTLVFWGDGQQRLADASCYAGGVVMGAGDLDRRSW